MRHLIDPLDLTREETDTLLDLAGISWNGFPESESLLRSSYRPRPRFTHEGHQPYVPRSSREGFR